MNRRKLTKTFIAAPLTLGASSFIARAQTPEATPLSAKRSNDVYLGALTTWHALTYHSVDRFHLSALDIDGGWSLGVVTAGLLAGMGVWNSVLADMQPISPPPEFQQMHDLLLRKLDLLERASRYYLDGIVLSDMELVREGSEFFNAAIEVEWQFVEEGYFDLLPRR